MKGDMIPARGYGAYPPSTLHAVQNVASISAGNDEFVGEMIASALDKVGSNGVLSIEASNSTETFVEVQEGMAVDRGYISPQFVTNNERLLTEFDNCRVLITDQKIEQIRDIVPILEQVGTVLERTVGGRSIICKKIMSF